jgi:uncharacterized protein YecE (DUF72 family)
MLSGQRALDLGSFERLKWHIKFVLKQLNDKYTEQEIAKILNTAEKRWNNGGKEIYEAFQNNPEFVDSPEYKKHMEDLEKQL